MRFAMLTLQKFLADTYFIDSGTFYFEEGDEILEIPWFAMKYLNHNAEPSWFITNCARYSQDFQIALQIEEFVRHLVPCEDEVYKFYAS